MRKLTIFVVIFLAMYACVPSIHPLYTEKDAIVDERILGTWVDMDSSIWEFRRAKEVRGKGLFTPAPGEKTISLLYTQEGNTQEFDVHMVELGDHYFLDLYPYDVEFENDMLGWHLLPVHTFARIDLSRDRTVIELFDAEWLEKLIDQNRIRIKHEKEKDYIILTASTRSLQKFVEKYGGEPEAFTEPNTLLRP